MLLKSQFLVGLIVLQLASFSFCLTSEEISEESKYVAYSREKNESQEFKPVSPVPIESYIKNKLFKAIPALSKLPIKRIAVVEFENGKQQNETEFKIADIQLNDDQTELKKSRGKRGAYDVAQIEEVLSERPALPQLPIMPQSQPKFQQGLAKPVFSPLPSSFSSSSFDSQSVQVMPQPIPQTIPQQSSYGSRGEGEGEGQGEGEGEGRGGEGEGRGGEGEGRYKAQQVMPPTIPQQSSYSSQSYSSSSYAAPSIPQQSSYSSQSYSSSSYAAPSIPQLEIPNTCAIGFSVPIFEGETFSKTYCRCPSGTYGFTCQENFVNPCGSGQQYFPADASIGPHYFIECSWNIPYLFKCPANLVWNQELLTCDWDHQESGYDNSYGGNYGETTYGGSSNYVAPQPKPQPVYTAPVQPTYKAQPSYAAPAQPRVVPVQPKAPTSYAAPAQPRMIPQAAPAYSAPAQPRIVPQAPASYGAPAAPSYAAPVQPRAPASYAAPAQPRMIPQAAPAQPRIVPQAPASYGAPAQPKAASYGASSY